MIAAQTATGPLEPVSFWLVPHRRECPGALWPLRGLARRMGKDALALLSRHEIHQGERLQVAFDHSDEPSGSSYSVIESYPISDGHYLTRVAEV